MRTVSEVGHEYRMKKRNKGKSGWAKREEGKAAKRREAREKDQRERDREAGGVHTAMGTAECPLVGPPGVR